VSTLSAEHDWFLTPFIPFICPGCYALGALGDDRAVPVLIELLADQDLRAPARRGLEALTKQKFGDDPELWKAWWKSEKR